MAESAVPILPSRDLAETLAWVACVYRSQRQMSPPSSRRSKRRPQRGHSYGITRARMKSAFISTTQSTA